jgi:2-keto-3-deoxy-6-phosphogluconate aldolase
MTAVSSTGPGTDPALGTLADAVLIPPFPGTTAPAWLLRALERGLAGVTLFGSNVTGDTAALSAVLRGAAATSPGSPTRPARPTRATPPSARSTTRP